MINIFKLNNNLNNKGRHFVDKLNNLFKSVIIFWEIIKN